MFNETDSRYVRRTFTHGRGILRVPASVPAVAVALPLPMWHADRNARAAMYLVVSAGIILALGYVTMLALLLASWG